VEKKFIERRVDREFRLPNHVVDIIKKNDNVLVSVRNLEKIYRIDLVIDGFRELVKTRKKSVLIVMGHGTLAEELRCKAMDLGEKVIFVGKYQQNQLAHILEFKPIIISAAISDAGLSSTVSECMVWGAICVLSNVADNWLWIERQHDKLLFNSDVESVVDSISYALDLSEDDRSIIMSRQRENLLANNDGLKSTENVVNKCYGQAEAS
jgi:glycosyltransferase involved in cell wall biosynthesis